MNILELLGGQKINGTVFDFSSIEVKYLGLTVLTHITALNYKQGLAPGFLKRGTILGRTQGEYSADGSMSVYVPAYRQMIKAIRRQNPRVGYMRIPFDISVMYSEIGFSSTVVRDQLVGARITEEDYSHSSNGDPLVVNVSLSIMQINQDGDGFAAVQGLAG